MKSIKGYETYFVTENGEVWSTKREKWLSKSYNNGYAKVGIKVDGVTHNRMVHRFVAEAFIPNPENKPCVNHINGIKGDNRVENLEWNTYSENNKHAFGIGLMIITEKCKTAVREVLGFKIIDTVSGKIYPSMKVATKETGISWYMLNKKLNGGKKNDTSLKFLIE